MNKKTLTFAALSLGVLLASCQQSTPPVATPTPTAPSTGTTIGSDTLSPQGIAATTSLLVGQTRQFNVTVNGSAPTPGQLVWTTTNPSVVTVTQSGLATAVAAGNATVRAAIASYPSAYIDFPIVVSAATTPPSTTPPSTTPPSAFAQRVLELTNAARAQARVCGSTSFAATAPLTYSTQLEQAAQGHATDMANKNYFSHTSLDGRTFDQRINATGYPWRTIGENIAAGQSTPESVVSGWLASAGHCANIMNPSFKELGVGYAYNANSTYRSYWVQDFGAR